LGWKSGKREAGFEFRLTADDTPAFIFSLLPFANNQQLFQPLAFSL